MAKSVLSEEKVCYICGSHRNIEKHHVYGASNRKKSERYGATVYLCHNCHNEPPNSVHHNSAIRLWLQELCQYKLMEKYNWTVMQFVNIFGRNYT